jgi:hypothetical protein
MSDKKLKVINNINKAIEVAKDLGDIESLDKVMNMLKKAKDYPDDEESDSSYGDVLDPEDLGEGFREFDPEEESSSGEDWLSQNDPEYRKQGENYEEYGDGEDEDSHRRNIEESEDVDGEDQPSWNEADEPSAEAGAEEVAPATSTAAAGKPASEAEAQSQSQPSMEEPEEEVKSGRFRQPSLEEIRDLRAYTRPWEQRAREMTKLQADPSKNPVLAHQGHIIEAREMHHKNRKDAYQKMVNSEDYRNADPIQQMEMDASFEKDWHAKNPEHLKQAVEAHHSAHMKGVKSHDVHAAAKDAAIRDMLSGGSMPEESMSTEEALQHAGGVKGEEGTQGTIIRDRASSFAASNPEFINQYAKEYKNKAKKVGNIDEMGEYDEGSKRDIKRILGDAPAKDPRIDKFFEHYHPLISMSASKVMKKLGLDPRSSEIDMSMLHEAGMHGLMQAINDYDHSNISKASFATHAGNKMRGLMQTALRDQDKVPHEVRRAQKQFMAQKQPQAPKVEAPAATAAQPQQSKVAQLLAHPEHQKKLDAFTRVNTHRSILGVKKPTEGK